LGFFVNEDGTSGAMPRNPADWTDEQRAIATLGVNGDANLLTLAHPLGTRADNFQVEGADKVEDNGWNWNLVPHTTDDRGVVTITTNAPALMLRLRY